MSLLSDCGKLEWESRRFGGFLLFILAMSMRNEEYTFPLNEAHSSFVILPAIIVLIARVEIILYTTSRLLQILRCFKSCAVQTP